MHSPHAEIAAALQAYFDGWHEGSPDKLKAIFHPSAHLYCAIDGALDDDGMRKVCAYVAARESPAQRGEARRDRILSIDVAGSEAAFAKVQIAIGQKLFTDYLSLLRIGGRWQIVSKTFTHEPLPKT